MISSLGADPQGWGAPTSLVTPPVQCKIKVHHAGRVSHMLQSDAAACFHRKQAARDRTCLPAAVWPLAQHSNGRAGWSVGIAGPRCPPPTTQVSRPLRYLFAALSCRQINAPSYGIMPQQLGADCSMLTLTESPGAGIRLEFWRRSWLGSCISNRQIRPHSPHQSPILGAWALAQQGRVGSSLAELPHCPLTILTAFHSKPTSSFVASFQLSHLNPTPNSTAVRCRHHHPDELYILQHST